jgi:RNA-binding protein 5/10
VFLRGLDALSTEDSVLNCLMHLTQLPIKSIKIGRDPLTQTSRGVCYVEMNSVVDAMFLHNQLLGEPPTIDEKLVSSLYFQGGMILKNYPSILLCIESYSFSKAIPTIKFIFYR